MKIARFVILLWSLPYIVMAADGVGNVADTLTESVVVLSDFLGSACLIIGIGCLFGAFLRYLQYRVNPFASPISTVWTLLIMGVLLVCLPLIYKLTESGIPYSVSVKL